MALTVLRGLMVSLAVAQASDVAVLMDSTPREPRQTGATIPSEMVAAMEAQLLTAAAVPAAKRFYDAVKALPRKALLKDGAMRPVWAELVRQLESFNPIFTATVLQVQLTMGQTGYSARDAALSSLIQPVAGEYGLGAGRPLAKSHRLLLAEFYESVTGEPLTELLGENGTAYAPRPVAAEALFEAMLRDVTTAGGEGGDAVRRASYALGYNLAMEFVASHLSLFALDSWRSLEQRHGLEGIEWEFLEHHAVGEQGHAEIGHQTAALLVPLADAEVMRKGMSDHDRDFAAFNHALADLLEIDVV